MDYSHSKWQSARRAEHDSCWIEAAGIWREIGENSQADACESIASATDKGDRWRRRVKELMARYQAEAYRQATEEVYGPPD